MKKKFLPFIFSLFFMIPCAFLISGCNNTNSNLELKVQNGYIQYFNGEEWNKIISISQLEGKDGADGKDADIYTIGDDGYWYKNGQKTTNKAVGEDGDEYTIGSDGYWYKNGKKTEYKAVAKDGADGKGIKSIVIDDENSDDAKTTYVMTFDDNSTFAFEIQNGKKGVNGTSQYIHIKYANEDPIHSTKLSNTPDKWMGICINNSQYAPSEYIYYDWYQIKADRYKYNVSYDYNLPDIFQEYHIKYTNSTEIVEEGNCVSLPELDEYVSKYFLGWYTGSSSTDVEFTEYSPVYRNVELVARWDTAKLEADMNVSGIMNLYFSEENKDFIVCNLEQNIPTSYKKIYASSVSNSKLQIPAFYAVEKSDGTRKYYPVTSITSASYDDNSVIESVYIPATIKNIEITFLRCNNLKSVTFSEGEQVIAQQAFTGCSALSSVYLPDGVSVHQTSFSTSTVLCHNKNSSLSTKASNGYSVIGDLSYGTYLILKNNNLV